MHNPRVLILGGGFAGLEAAFHLRDRLRDRVDITLVSRDSRFTFRPNTIYIPFGRHPAEFVFELGPVMRRRGIELMRGTVRDVDPAARRARIDETVVPFDYAIVATGAAMRPRELPGLAAHGHSIWSLADMLELRRAFEGVLAAARAGKASSVLFLVPPGNKCAGPLYELVLMLDTWLRRRNARQPVDIAFATVEPRYLAVFGPRLHDVMVEEFRERVIQGRSAVVAERVEARRVTFESSEPLSFDLLVSFPAYAAAVDYASLPVDANGFVAAELGSRLVVSHPEVYAVGDAADFPVKQAFLALLQADAAADHLEQRILFERTAEGFDPVSLCIMEQLDKATFAQVPLRLTGDPEQPVSVDPDRVELYRVGASTAWRAGKSLLGRAMPARFRSGHPFHAGPSWAVMNAGLRMMSSVLAS